MELSLKIYPDSALRETCQPVKEFNKALHVELDAMRDIMYRYRGVGLAANQVGLIRRFFIADVTPMFTVDYIEEFGEPQAQDLKLIEFINPKIVKKSGKLTWNEGCLSFPNIFIDVERSSDIVITAVDRFGKPFEYEAKNILAVCCQHEYDHLDGKVFIDKVGVAKRQVALSKLKKQKKSSE